MANNAPLISYFSRDFATLKQDLVNYARNYHSDIFKYLNDNSPDILFIELLAYIGDTLNYSLDKSFNEAFLETAQSRDSIIRIAQDLGFKSFYGKPSSTQITLSITVPAVSNADNTALVPDPSYLFGIFPGLSVQSDNGTNFECLDEINFAQDLNRIIIPNLDSNGVLLNYTIQKSVAVYAGVTKIQRFYVSAANSRPFLEILLDDTDVTEILSVLIKSGNTYVIPTDEEFRTDNDNIFYEVDNLAINKIFMDSNIQPQTTTDFTDSTINYGDWVSKTKRFVVRRDKNNQTFLTFGSTLVDFSVWNASINSLEPSTPGFSLSQVLNNMALGEVPPIDSTLFIKFRSGSGTNTNVLTNSITNIVDSQIYMPTNPGNLTVFDTVKKSLQVISNLPAVGGTNPMFNEEIKQSVGKVFSTGDRAVTYEDIKNLIKNMPVKYGQPFRVSYEEIKPQLLSFAQIKSYLDTKFQELLLLPSTVDRELKIQEMQNWIANYPSQIAFINSQTNSQTSLSTVTDSTMSAVNVNDHALWFGEKCRLYVLGLDSNLQPTTLYKDSNNVWRSPNTILKTNIKNYLREKRVIGDYIDIVDAKVVNFQVEFTILADKKNKQQVVIDCLTKLRDYFMIYNWQINQPIFISNVETLLQSIDGVINVVDLSFYNIFDTDLTTGRIYSPKEFGRYKYLDTIPTNTQNNRFKMLNFDNVIVSFPDTFLNCRFLESDLVGKSL